MMILLYIAAACFFFSSVPYELVTPHRSNLIGLGALFITIFLIAGGH